MSDRAAPSSDALGALGSDGWAQVLVAAKRLAARRDPQEDPELAALVALPTSRLVGGKARRRLTRHLAQPQQWSGLTAELPDDGSIVPELQALLDQLAQGAASRSTGPGVMPSGLPAVAAGDPAAAAKARAREARADRDRWQRRAEGAEARIAAMQAQLDERDGELTRLRDEVAALEAQLAAGATDRARAVEREGRRRDTELERLRGELAELRRADEQRRLEQRQRTERRKQLAAEEHRRDVAGQETDDRHDARFAPGRPSTLPSGVEPGTTEAARLLLHSGRHVIVDGYNVTLQHQATLELEQQRAWLVAQLGNLVARRRVAVTVVFDGERPGGGRPGTGARGVLVRFTGAGITADDEIVLDVEATDEPVTVVTDDRELARRVSASGADVIGTRSLLGVTA